jgi:hypothetical protein
MRAEHHSEEYPSRDICVTELELEKWKWGRNEEAITQHTVPPDP